MGDLFDYLDWRGDLSFTDVPLCDADRLILAELCYVDLSVDEPCYISEICEEVLRRIEAIRFSGAKLTILHHKEDEELLKKLVNCKRFSNIKIGHFSERINNEKEEQFGAMTVFLPNGSIIVVFRGTDWKLIGWKEDLNMTYNDAVSGQLSALSYISEIGRKYEKAPIYVTGHSKGGNLALYSTAFAPEDVKDRIIDATSLDGPGFTKKVIASESFTLMSSKMRTFMPTSSIVGTLFYRTGHFEIIESSASGVMQHIPYTWKIHGGDFVTTTVRSEKSRFVEDTINDFVEALTEDERKKVINIFWKALMKLDITEVDELMDARKLLLLVKNYSSIDEESKKLLQDTVAKLQTSIKSTIKKHKSPKK